MKFDQTILASDPKRQGNCLSACVATALSRPLDEVPHFIEFGQQVNGDDDRLAWWAMFLGFMAADGLWPTDLDSPDHAEHDETVFVMGMSERGVCHQVLYRNGVLWHDPHPSRAGLTDVRQVLAFRPIRHDHEPTTTEVSA